jgi:pimeloyl-ACP methyl ester carboxylesterase
MDRRSVATSLAAAARQRYDHCGSVRKHQAQLLQRLAGRQPVLFAHIWGLNADIWEYRWRAFGSMKVSFRAAGSID